MNKTLAKAIRAGITPPEPVREVEHADCTKTGSWADKVHFRPLTVNEKKSKKTDRTNRTHGANYAPKRWKKANPAYFFKGAVNLKG